MDTVTEETSHLLSNNPPPTPFEDLREQLLDLEGEAKLWFDGNAIESETQASAVAQLLDGARKLGKQADTARKNEKEPHAQAAKAVDEKWKPLLTAFDRIAECAKKAQTAWLIKLDREKREREEAARREAAAKEEEARRLAAQAAESGKLEDAQARDEAIKESQAAAREAGRAEHDTARAKGEGMTRAVGLRTVYRAQVDDRRLLLNHIATRDPDALTEFVTDWAAKQVRAGARAIPGVTVVEDKVAA